MIHKSADRERECRNNKAAQPRGMKLSKGKGKENEMGKKKQNSLPSSCRIRPIQPRCPLGNHNSAHGASLCRVASTRVILPLDPRIPIACLAQILGFLPNPDLRRGGRIQWNERRLLAEAAPIECIEHVTIGSGTTVGVARVKHIAHIQSTACRPARCRSWWWRGTTLRRLQRRVWRAVGRGGVARIICVGRLRWGATIVWRRVIRAGSLVSGSGAGDWGQVCRVRVIVRRWLARAGDWVRLRLSL